MGPSYRRRTSAEANSRVRFRCSIVVVPRKHSPDIITPHKSKATSTAFPRPFAAVPCHHLSCATPKHRFLAGCGTSSRHSGFCAAAAAAAAEGVCCDERTNNRWRVTVGSNNTHLRLNYMYDVHIYMFCGVLGCPLAPYGSASSAVAVDADRVSVILAWLFHTLKCRCCTRSVIVLSSSNSTAAGAGLLENAVPDM